MLSCEIIESKPILLGMSLERPFPLGFGTLERLPRILFKLTAVTEGKSVSGIGEASIDFPFSTYDAWDIYWALSNLALQGQAVNREGILTDRKYRDEILAQFPAAFTALNMALDDIHGKIEEKSILDVYHQERESGIALASISFQNKTDLLVAEVKKRYRYGFVPKPKVGRGVENDIETVKSVAKVSNEKKIPFVLDFNAQYEPDEFRILIQILKSLNIDLSNLLFIEQPTTENSSILGLAHAKAVLEECDYQVPVIADESFVTVEDAIRCASAGICLNFKIHKIGGIYHAKEIEKAIFGMTSGKVRNMVGGTFPTAIGRVYDQQAAAILETTSLPSDGWGPSTEWFTDEKHLIREEFQFDKKSRQFKPFRGHGLGITPDWSKINSFTISNPREEYAKIRSGGTGDVIRVDLKPGQSYSVVYKNRTGREPNWNI